MFGEVAWGWIPDKIDNFYRRVHADLLHDQQVLGEEIPRALIPKCRHKAQELGWQDEYMRVMQTSLDESFQFMKNVSLLKVYGSMQRVFDPVATLQEINGIDKANRYVLALGSWQKRKKKQI